MKTFGFASQHCNVISVLSILILIIILVQPLPVIGQVRAGMGYLKMLPGTRELGVAGTLTGALDYCYSFHANPAATGFLREWQWSASYTKWIADLYNASFLYGKRVTSLWSKQTRFAVGANYLGIPEFDSSNETAAPVSGNNLLLTTSFGQPINFISPNISIGANVKYFNSRLAQFEANSLIIDYGLLFRSRRFGFIKQRFGLFDYAIFSAGAAITNSGNAIKYISEGTPLPRTLRAGIALNLGTHNGFQLNLGTDYRQVRDEQGFLSVGSEINWSQFISMRMGYSFEDNILGHFTFGASLQLDDGVIKNIVLGRNNAMRFDLASNQNNELMASPYHGSLSYFTIGPENFKLIGPSRDAKVDNDDVTLNWQNTRDPDLFDDIDYWLLVDTDSTKIARIIEIGKRDKDELFNYLNNNDDIQVSKNLDFTQYRLKELTSGDYYWAVFSYDKDRHFRFAEMQNEPVARFQITQPDPKIIAIHFEPGYWITQDDYQGKLQITIANFGNRTAKGFSLSIFDSVNVQLVDNSHINAAGVNAEILLSRVNIPVIQPGDLDTLTIDWRTDQAGYHLIVARINELIPNTESEQILHSYYQGCYTIPKGTFTTDDTVVVQNLNRVTYELPYVGKVFFNSNSSQVDRKFIREWIMSPPLTTFAERAKNDPNLTIYLKGSADTKAGENIVIARMRASAVRDTLTNLGVKLEQITVLADTLLQTYRLPANEEDSRWIQQDRKYVEIIVDIPTEEELFGPLQNTYDEISIRPVAFQAKVSSAIPLEKGAVRVSSHDLIATLNIRDLDYRENIDQVIEWQLPESNPEQQRKWIENSVGYSIAVTDTLGRQFRTHPRQVFLKKEIVGKEKMYYVIAKFAKAKELYHFYWSNLLDRIPFLLKDDKTRMRFVGHGCAIGSDAINRALSQQRAQAFHQRFLADVKAKYPALYDQIKQRIDPPIGRGEHEPLAFKSYHGETLVLGDNETPIGRQLNRRVMVHFYTRE
jgi:outer membrane protein OmpA-like peptidoglycan-associated protein